MFFKESRNQEFKIIRTRRQHIWLLLCCGIIFCNSAVIAQTQSTELQEFRLPLEYRFPKPDPNPYSFSTPGGGLYLKPPSNVKTEIAFDPVRNQYVFKEKAGSYDIRTPYSMDMPDFMKYKLTEQKTINWEEHSKKSLSGGTGGSTGFMPQFSLGGETFDRIFGTNVISIVPQGSAELIFGLNTTRTENPNLSESARKNTTFDFDTRLQVNVAGSIGDKMRLGINFNTDASFDFENEAKLAYEGKEDEIIQKIEAGNITLPLPGSLITGSQSLFGLKTDLQFGKLSVTAVASQQKGQTSTIEIKGGSQINEFELSGDEYDANKHFFLAQYFRDHYEQSFATMPAITSGITITKIEVWVTNRINLTQDSRSLVAFMDLGESTHIDNPVNGTGAATERLPDNDTTAVFNSLYRKTHSIVRNINNNINGELSSLGLKPGIDFEKLENARMLTEREYTFHPALGYISLNTALNADEVLGVAYEYTYRGKTYKVGELSRAGIAGERGLMVKMLKGTNLVPRYPTWNLMMKNIYAIAYNIEKKDFYLNILYADDRSGNEINYIPEDAASKDILLRVAGLDRLNSQSDAFPDGVFDFVEGVTIDPERGRIIFPVLEPFGNTLHGFLKQKGIPDATANKYVFQALYDSTLTKAREMAELNKFRLRGTYSSEGGSEITLNAMNIPEGSVVVTAAGRQLAENVDYTVDYSMGRVKILDTGLLESGTPIKVSVESNALFAVQEKTMLGTHLNYKFSDNFNIGGTLLRLTERPVTQKVNIGDEPMANTMLGLNTNYNTDLPFLTTWVDKLPLIQTKAPSSLDFSGEFAQLLPGSSKAIMNRGTAYIDDFEGSETSYDLKAFSAWHLSGIPQGNGMFAESRLNNDLNAGKNRARLAWYTIDPLFVNRQYMQSGITPDHIRNNQDKYTTGNFVRTIYEEEIFKNKEHIIGMPTNIAVLNVAYYPRERGPYNYDSRGVSLDGALMNPAQRWGGMMREIQPSDFEANNIQFIEFWLMDPFVEDSLNRLRGGDMYFNLGNISEDVLKDARKFSEQGLPVDGDLSSLDSTAWGYVPKVQPIVHSFDNTSRTWQDVGLDGMGDSRERRFFGSFISELEGIVDQKSMQALRDDPSTDNFRYPRGAEWDAVQADILSRYKYFNGLDKNSSNNDFSNNGLPDEEDINRDNTMSETESYFQYKVSLRREHFEVGENYIVDKVTNDSLVVDGRKVPSAAWYQFRIPIDEYERAVGGIHDFKTIRFMRMFLTNCPDSLILRFARLELVRGEWRQYKQSFQPATPGTATPESSQATFEVASVNIEENEGKSPVPYRVPPGFDRAVDQTTREMQLLNEQAMVLRVKELSNGDARAVYKNVSYDMRRYKSLEMEIHAEAVQEHSVSDHEASVFIRIGTDYRNNFYEYEVPLKLTPWNLDNYEDIDVWPEENHAGVDLTFLPNLKQMRDDEIRRGSSVKINTVFPYDAGDGRKYYVCGNPNLANVRVVMIGIRYPVTSDTYTGETRSVEVWVNELRLSNVDNKGGWAANGRLAIRVADLATLAIAGETIQPGFGSIDSKVNGRSTEERNQYDLSASIELGKLLPERLNVQIPVYVGYAESFITPEYDPTNPDVKMEDALAALPDKAARDSLKSLAQDYTRRKSLNLTNVRINTVHEKPRFWNLSNLTFNYAYYETYRRNVTVEKDVEKSYAGGVIYDYSAVPLNITPLQKVPFLNKPIFRIIRDFNFNPKPNRISLGTNMSRAYMEMRTRNIDNPEMLMDPTVDKNWTWDRNVTVQWDLARTLKLDFAATNMARVDEPVGAVDRHMKDEYELWKDSVWHNIRNGGRTTDYHHQFSVNYTIPVNKLPFLDWTSATVGYSGEYMWGVAPIYADTSFNPGNTISNRNTINLVGQLNMTALYNKVPYFRRVTQPARNRAQEPKQYKTVTFERNGLNMRAGEPRSVQHNLKTQEVEIKLTDADGKAIDAEVQVLGDNRITVTTAIDVRRASIVVSGLAEKKGGDPVGFILQNAVRFILGIKSVGLSYTENGSTLLPGYGMSGNMFGVSGAAPGWPFLLGWQDRNFADKAAANNWLVKEEQLNSAVLMDHTNTLNFRGVFEPFQGIRITLSALRSYTENHSSYYIWDPAAGLYPDDMRSPLNAGNYSISVIALGTSFEKIDKNKNYQSAVFDRFRENRSIIAYRRASALRGKDPSYTATPDGKGGYDGYSVDAQDVMIPAFYATYTGKDPETVSLDNFPSYWNMLPNWEVNFDGLSNSAFIKKYFRSVSLRHSYKAVYTIGSYLSNYDYNGDIATAASHARDLQNNFIPRNDIASANINERFAPLVGVDLMFLNSLTARFAMNKERNVSLGLGNLQLTESRMADYIIGLGYVFNQVPLRIKTPGGEQKQLQSDLKVNADLSVRDNKTMIRRVGEVVEEDMPQDAQLPVQVSAGQNVMSIKISADYKLSSSFTLTVFFDRIVNTPFVSTSYKNYNTNFGFSMRFTLIQ